MTKIIQADIDAETELADMLFGNGHSLTEALRLRRDDARRFMLGAFARHRLAERARIVAWLRTGCMFCETDQEIADAIEVGDA